MGLKPLVNGLGNIESILIFLDYNVPFSILTPWLSNTLYPYVLTYY